MLIKKIGVTAALMLTAFSLAACGNQSSNGQAKRVHESSSELKTTSQEPEASKGESQRNPGHNETGITVKYY